MKFNTDTSALHFSNYGQHRIFSTRDATFNAKLAVDFVHDNFEQLRPAFKRNVQYISKSFYMAYRKAEARIEKIIKTEPISQSGTFILPIEEGKSNTIFYSIETTLNGDSVTVKEATVVYFMKSKSMPEPYLTYYIKIKGGQLSEFYISEEPMRPKHEPTFLLDYIISFLVFVKYCEVETKFVQPNDKSTHVGEKYLNKTKSTIEILDSNWFTTIVRSEAFMVGEKTGGILRLQPFGPGRTEKKWIWIAPFEKQGYTRKAKVLTDRTEEIK